jgi:hypothetical protein
LISNLSWSIESRQIKNTPFIADQEAPSRTKERETEAEGTQQDRELCCTVAQEKAPRERAVQRPNIHDERMRSEAQGVHVYCLLQRSPHNQEQSKAQEQLKKNRDRSG